MSLWNKLNSLLVSNDKDTYLLSNIARVLQSNLCNQVPLLIDDSSTQLTRSNTGNSYDSVLKQQESIIRYYFTTFFIFIFYF